MIAVLLCYTPLMRSNSSVPLLVVIPAPCVIVTVRMFSIVHFINPWSVVDRDNATL